MAELKNIDNIVKPSRSVMLGAIFLMATSAIGPAFLTQTSYFTEKFLADFGFAILASILIDIAVQVNVWRVICLSGLRGQDVADKVIPGFGKLLAILIVVGGIVFNIGNVAGAGLGLQVLTGMSVEMGGIISGILALLVFVIKNAGKAMDRVAQCLGSLMILLVAYVMLSSHPPYGEAVVHTIMPENVGALVFPLITLIGGTVGGYITFSGAHRLIDAGITGEKYHKYINQTAINGILTTGVMRVLLFLAVLGVVSQGYQLDPTNPAASVFEIAAGSVGYYMFGLVIWAAALTSIIGAAYTSVSFLKSFGNFFVKFNNQVVIAFIIISTIIFVLVGRPVAVMVVVGSINGLVLPLTLIAIIFGASKKSVMGENYKHPLWLSAVGLAAAAVTAYVGIGSLEAIIKMFD